MENNKPTTEELSERMQNLEAILLEQIEQNRILGNQLAELRGAYKQW